ncbi:NAD(P)H-binding protein [Curtobacterium sp. PhB136]|uniref:SDR family oxidoreductase n=1 Tax=Curtobacterium sp. PhB136 TaxID=2485181 RepID=UPI001050061C|nr:NAD(P)H-binding protein [Curtobacterium sp. PhB136]TCK65784.1 uncharacterized protein YbjT (DUF2867 family) [Curtobacterium sp. PhB136]
MRIAVAGATGMIGSLIVAELARARVHEVVPMSRSSGVDLLSGDGLDAALRGADVVIDVSNSSSTDPDEMISFFEHSSRRLVQAGARAGVRHHILLSIIGVDATERYPHFIGKRRQEQVVTDNTSSFSIVRATQFFEFAETAMLWGQKDDHADVPPLLMQPVDTYDVASYLIEVATSNAPGGFLEIAGPERHDLVDVARRTLAAKGRDATLVPSWDESGFGVEMSGNVLLPHVGARIAPTTFDDWLTRIATLG